MKTTKTKIFTALLIIFGLTTAIQAQGFSDSANQWNIPVIGSYDYRVYDDFHSVLDFNGDGKPDLIDSLDDVSGTVFLNGTQKYWKVYLNTGLGFSPTAIEWNIPVIGSYDYKVSDQYHQVLDFDGDGKPDLIDTLDDLGSGVFLNGTQKYWKVYLNTGSGFSPTAIEWNIPAIGSYDYLFYDFYHAVVDFNGDGKPDLIDSLDDVSGNVFLNGTQKYWKVYLNTGSGFSLTAIEWNIPVIGSYDWRVYDDFHSVLDFNGDDKPDLIDSLDDLGSGVFLNGTQKYWKVYLNTGSGFSATAVDWNIPAIGSYDYKVYDTYHSVIDFDADGKPDLIDSLDDLGSGVFLNGTQKYWKVYLNTGSGFSPAFTQWNMPVIGSYDYNVYDNYHSVLDFDGDEKPDLIDSLDDATGNTFLNGTQKYWKVYLNIGSNLATDFFEKDNDIAIYPNPTRDFLNVSVIQEIDSVVIYNALGQEVMAQSLNANEVKIDVSDLQQGIYILKVFNNKGEAFMKRFIKK
ncbi:T9SS type A sorting domain-containing protein [Flavobacterium sp.]|uniref:T9SS type A sorting domain-containing protein n=1 Tax=Flavobacterium sp. TaxID=239 RepID=UPI00286CC8BE|nr:T9SS type A sorting domain-containing protein [Flavobacterium sp.]